MKALGKLVIFLPAFLFWEVYRLLAKIFGGTADPNA